MKQKPFVIFQIDHGEKTYSLKVNTEDLRNLLKKAGKYALGVNIEIDTDEGTITESIPVSQVKQILKKSELQQAIVPRWMAKYLRDLTYVFSMKNYMKIEGRDNEIEKIWFYLSQKTRNNVFLIGPPDVGKSAIAYEIVRQIATNECPKEFYDSRVLEIKIDELLKIKHDFIYEKVIDFITNFLAKNKDRIVLYVDKALHMKTEVNAVLMLYNVITSLHIPIITTEYAENFEEFFLQDSTISKYLNYVYIEEPELDEIEPMVKPHILRLKKRYNINISSEMINFGIFTSKLSNSESANPGNVINIFERAFLEAKRKDKTEVDKVSILSCYDTYLKMYQSLTEKEKKSTSYHESGHFIACINSKYRRDVKIAFVSILPMMNFMGVNWLYTDIDEETISSKEYYMDDIICDLAGRVAEMRVTGKYSSGACSDLKQANIIAKAMIMKFGLSEESSNRNRFYDDDDYVLLSEEKKEQLDNEIQKIINTAYEEAEKIISDNAELLEVIAERLLKDEILTGKQLEKICKKFEETKKKTK